MVQRRSAADAEAEKARYEAAKEIRKTKGEYFSRIPIIAMSANAFTDDVEKVKEAGMNDYISKPVEVDKLIKAIETWHIL